MLSSPKDIFHTLVQEGILALSLHHVLAMKSEVKHTAVQVDGAFRVQLLQNSIQSYKSPSAANTSTAVNNSGSSAGRPVHIVSHCAHELDERLGALGDAVIRPNGVVEVTHQARVTAAALRGDPELSDGPFW